jgi:hypothetical protein
MKYEKILIKLNAKTEKDPVGHIINIVDEMNNETFAHSA